MNDKKRRLLLTLCIEIGLCIIISVVALTAVQSLKGRKADNDTEVSEESSGEESPEEADDADSPPEQYKCVGKVESITEYGALMTDISPSRMSLYGIDQNDLVEVYIGDNRYILPVEIDEKLNTFWGRTRLSYDEESNHMYVIRELQDFAMMEGYNDRDIGETVSIELLQSDGYQMTMQEPLGLSENVANFRPVRTGRIGYGVIYRGHSPIDPRYKNIRCRCADDLAWEVEVKTVINLNQDEAEVRDTVYNECPESYYRFVFDRGDVSAVRIEGRDSCERSFIEGIAAHMLFIIEHEPPFLIHCRMGKDRAGFVIALLQALEGTSYNQIGEEYAISFRNYYGVEKGTYMDQYNITDGSNTFLLMMQGTGGNIYLNDDGTLCRKAAKSYLARAGLSELEIEALQKKLENIN